jgi:DCN1-like protein 4/5
LASFAVVLNDLYDLIVLGRPAVAISRVKSQRGATYNTTRYDSYATDTQKAFSSFYSFCFVLAKPEYVRYFLLLNADAHVTIQGAQGTLTWKLHALSGQFC